MGTAAIICKTKNGIITKCLLVNRDGYLEGVGAELLSSWNSADKVDKLLQYTFISDLEKYPFVRIRNRNYKGQSLESVKYPDNTMADDIAQDLLGFPIEEVTINNIVYSWDGKKWNYAHFSSELTPLSTALNQKMNGHRTRAPAKKHSPAVKVNVRKMF